MKIPKRILHAVAMYYANRSIQREANELYRNINKLTRPEAWDKTKDLEALTASCKGTSVIGFQAIAGTFWFFRNNTKGCYKMCESTFPDWVYEPPEKKP